MPATNAVQPASDEQKFFTANYFPCEQAREEFLSLFNPYGYIYKSIAADSAWQSANKKWRLSSAEIFKSIAYINSKSYYGTRASSSTRFAVLDIDKNSPYNNQTDLKGILVILEEAGILDVCLYRSSNSGGWHLYIFFESPVPTGKLRAAMIATLTAANYQIRQGWLEIFPNRGSFHSQGVGLRLPLQPGWAWLDHNTLKVLCERADLTPQEALDTFLDDLAIYSHSDQDFQKFVRQANLNGQQNNAIAILKSPVSIAKLKAVSTDESCNDKQYLAESSQMDAIEKVTQIFGYVPPGMNCDGWLRGRNYAVTGLTNESQRHDCQFCLNHYFFYGDPSNDIPAFGYNSDQERGLLVQAILDQKHNGFSKEITQNSAEWIANVWRQAKWKPQHKRGIMPLAVQDNASNTETSEISPLSPRQLRHQYANLKRSNSAREKINDAVEQLLQQRIQISLTAIHKLSGVAISTIRRHSDLWKTRQEEQYEDLFAALSGDLNGVDDGNDQQISLSTESSSERSSNPASCHQAIYKPGTCRINRHVQISMHNHNKTAFAAKLRLVPQTPITPNVIQLQLADIIASKPP